MSSAWSSGQNACRAWEIKTQGGVMVRSDLVQGSKCVLSMFLCFKGRCSVFSRQRVQFQSSSYKFSCYENAVIYKK